MEVTGTVTSVRRTHTSYGSSYIRVTIARPGTHEIPLTWLHTFETIPVRGQHVTITGIPMMMRLRRGHPRANISVDRITVHDQNDEES